MALENKKVHPLLAFFVGLFAGFGFALKPFFLVTPVLVELYFMWQKKNFFAWVRVESITALFICFFYLFSVWYFQPGYFQVILPLVSHFYFIGIKEEWISIFLGYMVLYLLAILLVYLGFRKLDQQRNLSNVLTLAMIGMLIAVLIPRAPWSYHLLPALGLGCLILTVFLSQVVKAAKQKSNQFLDRLFLCLVTTFFFSLPIINYYYSLKYWLISPRSMNMKEVTAYINTFPKQQALFCFSSTTTDDCFPLVYDTKSRYASRMPFFWWFFGALKVNGYEHEKKYLIDQVANDLDTLKPTLILVSTVVHEKHAEVKTGFIDYFSQNEKFRNIWKKYIYLTTLGDYKIYKYKDVG